MSTVGKPVVMTPPCAVRSAPACTPPISTVADPITVTSGGPAQMLISPTRAAEVPPMITGRAADRASDVDALAKPEC